MYYPERGHAHVRPSFECLLPGQRAGCTPILVRDACSLQNPNTRAAHPRTRVRFRVLTQLGCIEDTKECARALAATESFDKHISRSGRIVSSCRNV
jgi:hypothetical protein